MTAVCGRYVSSGSLADLGVLLGVDPFAASDADLLDGRTAARSRERAYNLAPTDPVPAVLPRGSGRQLALLTWGLVPAWADPSTGAQRINARIETVLDKPSFRRAVRSRRCLLPADGWYEWVRQPDGRRRPYFVQPADGSLLAFAGLYEHWRSPDETVLRTSAILTGPAPAPLAWLHERAPVAVPPDLWGDWLDPATDAEGLLLALQALPAPEMSVLAVSTSVNDVRNGGPGLIVPVEPAATEQAELW